MIFSSGNGDLCKVYWNGDNRKSLRIELIMHWAFHPKNVDFPISTLKFYKPSIRLNFLTVKSPAKEDTVEAGRVAERLERWTCKFKSHPDRLIDLFSVIPSSNPRPRL